MKKILVIRNDKIGDFMLAWPSFAMLKNSLPECHITALVPSYTVELSAPDYFSGAFFTPEEEIDLCFNENLPAMLYFANYFITKRGRRPQPLHGQFDAVLSGRHLKSLFFLQVFTGY